MRDPKLSESEVSERLRGLSAWKLNDRGELTRSFEFKGFKGAMFFVNAVAYLAEAADHHPDILIQYNRVALSLVTHDSGGLTRRDFELAAKIDGIVG